MDYLTRKSVVIQYGAVGSWTYGGYRCPYPCLSALGVRNPKDNQEIKEALDDLAVPLDIPENSAQWTPEVIEQALAKAGSPKEWFQRAHEALARMAAKSKLRTSRESE